MTYCKPLFTAVLLIALLAGFVFAGTLSYTYDEAGRLTGADYGAGKAIAYTYDHNGNLLKREVQSTPPTAQHTLTVTVSPTGSGSVTGTGINCSDNCTEDYAKDTMVKLTAAAAEGMQFLRWEGAITGSTNPDSLTMDQDKEVLAYFDTDTDVDGVADVTESGRDGDNLAYDGNDNDVPDYQEAGAASLPSAKGEAYVTVALPEGSTNVLGDVQAEVNPLPGDAPDGVEFPYGFFSFAIENLAASGDLAQTILFLPKDTDISTYYMYGPTPDNHTDHWYEFLYDGETGAEIVHEATTTRIVLHFRDGARGDNDLSANSRIADPGGPGIRQSTEPIPTLSEWGMILLCLLLGLISLASIRGRREPARG